MVSNMRAQRIPTRCSVSAVGEIDDDDLLLRVFGQSQGVLHYLRVGGEVRR